MRHTNDTIHCPLGILSQVCSLYCLLICYISTSIGGNSPIRPILFLTIITRPIVASKLWKIDILGKSSFQRSVYTEFFELVTNLTMDSKFIEVKCKLCPPPKNDF